jgi:nucleoside-diphosphate-sugar epimerase
LESLTSSIARPRQQQQQANLVFVAGATGRCGARIVRELLKQGNRVRAGVRDVEGARESLDVAQALGLLTPEQARRVDLVPFNLSNREGMRSALGGASVVVCAVGAPESDALNPGAPKAIDGEGSIALINEAAAAGVPRFVLISSLGTGKPQVQSCDVDTLNK